MVRPLPVLKKCSNIKTGRDKGKSRVFNDLPEMQKIVERAIKRKEKELKNAKRDNEKRDVFQKACGKRQQDVLECNSRTEKENQQLPQKKREALKKLKSLMKRAMSTLFCHFILTVAWDQILLEN
ncbi:unnamed protein product [Psylliodes chrysocephalus]|uniref:Uncharacterized protein n=1 Tax=Psylliodes chrysocephalus TaxID=3402493 RepID=A0A9P0GJX3_9CUCU|nr:unnamed protein product [Psylliodes chrysocephala]